ncbi:SulP family inorganic anion transporter [Niabella hibiscisoli]|uniref:SulP family inorganic anion transporter n=1 Tax=Niabella hibiscisoli TaxID=1825928 RepID=UPI0021D43FBC|nr:SulP family inorganic anion transporter [Niabella hibiscisoli]
MTNKPRSTGYIKSLANDLPASIVVFLVALPLCLGVALASNAPLFSGIIAGVCGGIVVGIFSGSQLSVSGPAAGLTAIVAAAITSLASFEAFLLVVVLAGAMQMVLGFLKAGVIGDYVPNSVIKGMLAAIGLILILNQFPHLLEIAPLLKLMRIRPTQTKATYLLTSLKHLAALIPADSLLEPFVWHFTLFGKAL